MPQPRTLHREGYYTYDEAAEYLQVSERTIRNHIKRGLLRPVGVQRPFRFPQEQVHALLPRREEVAPPAPPAPVESPFYTVTEAAAYLRVGKATI